jgi:molybdate transport system substrate-binding protein
MNELKSKGLLINQTRKDILRNEVVLIIPAGTALPVKNFGDLKDPPIKRIAIRDPAFVLCGRYTKEVLENFGLWEALKS